LLASAEALLALRGGADSDEALVGAMLVAEFLLRVNRFLAKD
jgi:hypothetical protein